MTSKKQNAFLMYLCLLAFSFLLLAVGSLNSFLYTFNPSPDVHCFLTTARCMLRGDVLYRDVYEHKGPILYFIYMIGLKITPNSTVGSWLIEVIFFWGFLLCSYKTVRLYTENRFSRLFTVFLTGMTAALGKAMWRGGQCDEFSLPFLALTLYLVLKHEKEQPEQAFRPLTLILSGIGFAAVFWMKYTLTGFYIGLVLMLAVTELSHKRIGRLLLYGSEFLLGALIGSLPVILYCTLHSSFYELWDVYFYTLIFKYSGNKPDSLHHIWSFTFSFSIITFLTYLAAWLAPKSKAHGNDRGWILALMSGQLIGIASALPRKYDAESLLCFLPCGIILAARFAKGIANGSQQSAGMPERLRSAAETLRSKPYLQFLLLFVCYLVFSDSTLSVALMKTVVILSISAVLRQPAKHLRHTGLIILTLLKYTAIIISIVIIASKDIAKGLLLYQIIYDLYAYGSDLTARLRKQLPEWKKEYQKTVGAKPLRWKCVLIAYCCIIFILFFPFKKNILLPRNEYWQHTVADKILGSGVSNPQILYLGCLDQGIYWLTDTYPPDPKFCSYNLYMTLDETGYREKYLENGKADFIVSLGTCDALEDLNYHIMYQAQNYDATEYLNEVYLYARSGLCETDTEA